MLDEHSFEISSINVESFSLTPNVILIDSYEPFTYNESIEKDKRNFLQMFWTYILDGIEIETTDKEAHSFALRAILSSSADKYAIG